MSIHVHRSVESGWTKLANTLLRDPDLSLRAKGLLAQLLSHEDGWQQSIRYAQSQCRDGKDAIGTALTELIAAGYVTRELVQEGTGRFRGYRYDVYDTRAGSTPELSGFTVSGRTGHGLTNHGESAPLEDLELEEDLDQKKTEKPSAPQAARPTSYSAAFEAFWAEYPIRKDKRKAFKAFKAACRRAPLTEILAGVERYKAALTHEPDRPVKYAEGWLNGDRWLDEEVDPQEAALRLLRGGA